MFTHIKKFAKLLKFEAVQVIEIGMKDRVRLSDIAAEAGVSVGTVSQALRSTGDTGKKTSARIREIADRMGYRPDPLMASLGSMARKGEGQPLQIPVAILSIRSREQLKQYPVLSLDEPLEENLKSRGFRPSFLNAEDPKKLNALLRECYWKGVRGIVVTEVQHPEWLEGADWSPFSVVMLGGWFHRATFHSFCTDSPLAMEMALELALERPGKTGTILFEHQEQKIWADPHNLGVWEYFKERYADRVVPKTLRLHFEDDFERSTRRVRQWFRTHHPDTIVTYPLGAACLKAAGLQPGTDFHIIYAHSQTPEPGVAAFIDDYKTISASATRFLDSMIRHHETGRPDLPMVVKIPPRLSPGEPE